MHACSHISIHARTYKRHTHTHTPARVRPRALLKKPTPRSCSSPKIKIRKRSHGGGNLLRSTLVRGQSVREDTPLGSAHKKRLGAPAITSHEKATEDSSSKHSHSSEQVLRQREWNLLRTTFCAPENGCMILVMAGARPAQGSRVKRERESHE